MTGGEPSGPVRQPTWRPLLRRPRAHDGVSPVDAAGDAAAMGQLRRSIRGSRSARLSGDELTSW